MRLADRVAVVTGAAHGIGEATAQRLSQEGAAVVVVDVHEDGEQVARRIGVDGSRTLFIRADVSSEVDVDRICSETKRAFGRLDVLVNNAAITLPKGFESTTPAEWDRVQGINLRAFYLTMRAAAPLLRENKGSAVVNVASFHANATIENFAAYASAKSGVIGLTRSSALDLAPHGVRVNAVCPGIVDTAMWQAWLAEVEDVEATIRDVLKLQPLGRIGRPAEVANAILFLASDEAAYITGTALYVDGGVTARLSHV